MPIQKAKWIQAFVALAIVGAAVATWFGRTHVEAAASAVFGVGEAQSTAGEGRRGRRGRGGGQLPVVVAKVASGQDNVVIEAIGTARANRSVTLYPPIAGEVATSEVKAGTRVPEGTVLFRLDAKKAQLALDMARSKRLDAERKLKRAQQLRSRNVSSNATVDDARTAFERADIELKQAEEILSDLVVQAPFTGVLGIPKVEPGDRITPTTALVTLDDRSELIVEFEVPERYLPRLDAGHPVEGRTPGFPREVFSGAIRSIDSRIDPTARTVKVRAALPNRDDRLRPGMSFAVLVTLEGKVFPKVPEVALLFSQQGNYVWAVTEDSKARKVPVVLVRRVDSEVLIDGALTPGSLVVVEGVQRLRPGRAVKHDGTPDAKQSNPLARSANGQRS